MKNNKKGFTLAELLVVVAIIGILVAVSIPIFTAQLNKARKATNQANLRAAKAAAVAQYLTDSNNGTVSYSYDIANGTISTAAATGATAVTISEATDTATYTVIGVSVSGTTVTLYAQ